jgi:hypothetical protein
MFFRALRALACAAIAADMSVSVVLAQSVSLDQGEEYMSQTFVLSGDGFEPGVRLGLSFVLRQVKTSRRPIRPSSKLA